MSTNSGFKDAPPTRNPSTSSCVAIQTPSELSTSHYEGGEIRTKFLGIRRSDRAAVNDPRRLRNALRHPRLQESTDLGMGILRLCRSGNLARADRPHRLVRNHDVATKQISGSGLIGGKRRRYVLPVGRTIEDVYDSLELRIDHLCRPPRFSFREGFSDTEDHFEGGIYSCLGFAPDKLGGFVEQCTALGVP